MVMDTLFVRRGHTRLPIKVQAPVEGSVWFHRRLKTG